VTRQSDPFGCPALIRESGAARSSGAEFEYFVIDHMIIIRLTYIKKRFNLPHDPYENDFIGSLQ
jgi:hypothetical protein